jgi:sec-independent protein translocase protein TatC
MADVQMPLTEHLEELRWRVVKALAAIGIAFAVCYYFSEPIFAFLTEPLLAINRAAGNADTVHLIGTGVVEAFFTKLKVSFIAAIFVASPWIFYQLWLFVAPGLHDQEKRYAKPFVFFGTLFFVSGAVFCFYVVLPFGYQFFITEYQSIRVDPQIRISEYLTFTARMLLAFGVIFEMPVVTFFLARTGFVNSSMMWRSSRYAVLIIFIVAAILTPPDVATQLLMAAPLLLLYGISILVAHVFGKPRGAEPPSA